MGVAVLLFGKRLPEVGRSLGKGIIEFKKGLAGSRTVRPHGHKRADVPPRPRDDEHVVASTSSSSDHADTTVPKFEHRHCADAGELRGDVRSTAVTAERGEETRLKREKERKSNEEKRG